MHELGRTAKSGSIIQLFLEQDLTLIRRVVLLLEGHRSCPK